jgi:hypothetical protein
MSLYHQLLSVRSFALLLLTLTLIISGCAQPLPDLGPTGQEAAPLESDSVIPVPPQPPITEGDSDANPEVVLTAEAGGQRDFVIGVGLERMIDDDETLYEDALVPGIQLAISQINESGFLGEGRQMALIVDGAALPADPTAPEIPEQIAFDNIVASLGPLLPYADSEESALPLILRPDAGTDVFGSSQYVDNWVYQLDTVSNELTLQTVLLARDYFNLNTIAIISRDVAGTDREFLLEQLALQGIDVVAAVTLEEGSSATDLLLQVGEANPNAVLLNTSPGVAVDILSAAQNFEFPTPTYFIGGAGVVNPELLARIGAADQGLIGGVNWLLVPPFAPEEGFAETFQTIYGVEPNSIGAKGYAATWLLAEAVRTTDNPDSIALRDTLATLTQVETPFGLFTLDATPPDSTVLLYVNEDGEIVVVGE